MLPLAKKLTFLLQNIHTVKSFQNRHFASFAKRFTFVLNSSADLPIKLEITVGPCALLFTFETALWLFHIVGQLLS